MKLTKNPVFLHYFSKIMGILLFLLKYMYISLLLKMIYGFSWPAKIMASPFNHFVEPPHTGPSTKAYTCTYAYSGILTSDFNAFLLCSSPFTVKCLACLVIFSETEDKVEPAHVSLIFGFWHCFVLLVETEVAPAHLLCTTVSVSFGICFFLLGETEVEPAHSGLWPCFVESVLLAEIKVEPALQCSAMSVSFGFCFVRLLSTGTAVSWSFSPWHCSAPLDTPEVDPANLLGITVSWSFALRQVPVLHLALDELEVQPAHILGTAVFLSLGLWCHGLWRKQLSSKWASHTWTLLQWDNPGPVKSVLVVRTNCIHFCRRSSAFGNEKNLAGLLSEVLLQQATTHHRVIVVVIGNSSFLSRHTSSTTHKSQTK